MPRRRRCSSTPRRCGRWRRVEGWWEDVRRPAVLTPHAGEFARLRTASGRDAEADGDLNADDAARATAAADAAREWRQVVVLEGRADGDRGARRRAGGRAVREPGPGERAEPGDVLSGTIGSLLAQGLAPFAAARLGVYLHGLAGEAVRAADRRCRPARLRPARRDRASRGVGWRRYAERAAPRRAVGFGSREAAAERRPDRGIAADVTSTAASDIDRRPRARPACRRCREPPGSRSISTGSSATSRAIRAPCRPASAWSPSSRPTPTATARCRSRARSRRPAPTACRSPRGTRRWSCGAAGIRLPILVLYPVPPAFVAEAAARRASRSRSATSRSWRGRSTAWRARDAAARPTGAPLHVQLEVETGLGRGGVRRRRIARAAVAAIAGHPGRRAGRASGRTSAPPAIRSAAAAPGARASTRSRQLARDGGVEARCAPPSRRERRHPRRTPRPRYDAVRPGPLDLRGRARRASRSRAGQSALAAALRPVAEPAMRGRSASSSCRPAPGVSYGERLRHGAPEPDRDAARRLRATATSGSGRTGRRPWSAGTACRSSAPIAMDAVMADVTDVPRPAGRPSTTSSSSWANRATGP